MSFKEESTFNIPLRCFVAVDSNFKTRLVACVLTCTERTEDFKRILTQLLLSSGGELTSNAQDRTRSSQNIEETGVVAGGFAPKVIMVDEDLAMDLACKTVIPESRIINCKWHIDQNIDKNLRKALGPAWEAFQGRLNAICAALTPEAFETGWNDLKRYLQDNYLDICDPANVDSDEEGNDDKGSGKTKAGGKVGKCLAKLYKQRYHGGGLCISACFTAVNSGLAVDNSPIAKPEDRMKALIAAPMTHIFFESKATQTDDKEETSPKHASLESKVTVTPLDDHDENFCFDEICEAEILDAMNEINGLEESITVQDQE
ncbi:hypothetical protein BGZ80_007811 [Entomortierella chlamydospora]|uniref:MULE transposase domain-containing protein n=1 Tax=Entomortierella chlamydospora TaxID=101097 RepID=A0A9P6MY28_9FUNG|nr:hypothetical protein BGZ80_007811 [Entomortierella chlamydospora]